MKNKYIFEIERLLKQLKSMGCVVTRDDNPTPEKLEQLRIYFSQQRKMIMKQDLTTI